MAVLKPRYVRNPSLNLRRKLLGEQHPDYASSLEDVAWIHNERKDYVVAATFYRQAFAVLRKTLGEAHEDCLDTQKKLAKAIENEGRRYFDKRRFSSAELLYLQDLAYRKQRVGEKHLDYVAGLNNLASLYFHEGDFARALVLNHQLLKLRKQILGEKHPAYAVSLNDLATVYDRLARRHLAREDFTAAAKAFQAAQFWKTQLRGENHWEVTNARLALSHVARLTRMSAVERQSLKQVEVLTKKCDALKKSAKPHEAIAPARLALAIRERILGSKHPDSATSMLYLADLFRDLEEYRTAEPLYQQALAIRKELLGPNHPEYSLNLNNFGILHYREGSFVKAAALFRQALDSRIRAVGEKYSDVVINLNNLVNTLEQIAREAEDREDFVAARKAHQEIISVKNRVPGARPWEMTDARLALTHVEKLARLTAAQRQSLKQAVKLMGKANALERAGKRREAIALVQQTLAVRKQALGEKHRDYATILDNLAGLHLDLGEYRTALPLYQQALALRKELLEPDHPDYCATLNDLAVLYYREGDFARAEALHREAVTIRTRIIGEKHSQTIHSLNELALTLEQIAAKAEAGDDFVVARQARDEVLAIRRKIVGERHWQFTDARLALENVTRLVQLSTLQRQCLREAEALDGQVKQLVARGKSEEAKPLASRSLAIHKEVLGEETLACARCLDDLAALSFAHPWALTDHQKALPLYLQALRIRRKLLGDEHLAYLDSRKNLTDRYDDLIDKLFQINDEKEAPEVLSVAEQRLAFVREVAATDYNRITESLMTVARLREYCEDFSGAAKALEERLLVLVKLRSKDHPQIADAKFALDNVRRLSSLSTEQRKRLRAATLLLVEDKPLRRERELDNRIGLVMMALAIHEEILGAHSMQYAQSLCDLGSLYYQKKEYWLAVAQYERALTIHKEVVGEKHPKCACVLHSLATLFQALGDYSRAEDLYRRALAIRIVTHGDTDNHTTASASGLAETIAKEAKQQLQRGNFAQARKLRQEVLAIHTKLFGDKNWRTTDARLELADIEHLARMTAEQRHQLANAAKLDQQATDLVNQGVYRGGIPFALEALKLRKELLGDEHHDCAHTLHILSRLYLGVADFARAERTSRLASAMLKKTLGPNHPGYIFSLYNLGVAYSELRDDARAEPLLNDAAELLKQVLGEKHPQYRDFLGSLAEVNARMGNFAKAVDLSKKVIALHETELSETFSKRLDVSGFRPELLRAEASTGKYPKYVASMQRLARLYVQMGRYAQAIPTFRRILTITREASGENSTAHIAGLYDLGWAYWLMGDSIEAEALISQALNLARRTLGEKSHMYANCLNMLGRLHYHLGGYARADRFYRRAIEILKVGDSRKSLSLATVLDNLALLEVDRRNYSRAEPLYHRALKIKMAVQGANHPNYAISLNNLGELYKTRGELAAAERVFRRAMEIYQTTLGENHREFIISQSSLADVLWLKRDFAKTEPLMRKSLESSIRNLEVTATVQPERQQLSMLRSLRYLFDDYLALASQAGKTGEAVYRHVFAWKGCVLQRQRQLRLMRQHPEFKATRLMGSFKGTDGKTHFLIGSLASKFERLEWVTRALSTLALTVPETKEKEMRHRLIENLTREKEQLESELADVSTAFREEIANTGPRACENIPCVQ